MDYLSYTKKATSPYQAVTTSAELLEEAGFEALDLKADWQLACGRSYQVNVYGTTLAAFTIGSAYQAGNAMRLQSAHTDNPGFRIKPQPEVCDNGYLKLNVECYGGLLEHTWTDRPLSIAGRVMLRGENLFEPREVLVDFERPLLTIPNLAIHMNRDANKGTELNRQTELVPIIGLLTEQLEKDSFFLNLLAKEIEAKPEEILDFDLYIYNAEEGCRLGMDGEFIQAPRLDNLTSCYSLVRGITESHCPTEGLNLICLFDNEEIGSRSKQGADSMLLKVLLEKIYAGLGFEAKSLNQAILNSMMLSCDVAHAYHPNFGGKYDPKLHCIPNEGVVLKLNYSQKYATDTKAIAILQQLCEEKEIPYRKFANRSDLAGGSTLGAITSAYLPMLTADLGVGILAMHSARETMGTWDLEALTRLCTAFFEA